MLQLLWLIPAIPFLGYAILALAGRRMSRAVIASVGVGTIALSAIITILVAFSFMRIPGEKFFAQTLWNWISIGGINIGIGLYLDALSLLMIFVVTFVGFLIHLYSVQFMIDEEGYSRFFAYMNLFVGSMLTLVLADNLLLLYLGWEGVGLCSYLLIGFWYKDPANGRAARKAFIVTRVGDTAMAIGLFILLQQFGTLHIQSLMEQASARWAIGSGYAIACAALLLGGAVGKSGQLPLQTWLPDAMAGPTPVSALIHAATMVTAGVYLIARMHVLYTLAPTIQFLVAIIGALTLLLAGFSALTQTDFKRILAYSTISQIGYMFLALGVGAWSAAMFHFMTHAFFKALLFMAAGVVILALHEEHNIFRMGGMRRKQPLVFWTFLIAAASLSAFPLITAGFYSKELILYEAFTFAHGGLWLYLAGIIGAFITTLYTFRMVFVVFFDNEIHIDIPPAESPKSGSHAFSAGKFMAIPLIILAILSIVAGFIELPVAFSHISLFSAFMSSALPAVAEEANPRIELILMTIAAIVDLLAITIAWLIWLRSPQLAKAAASGPVGSRLHRFWYAGWGFDWLYDRLLVRPFIQLAKSLFSDPVDSFFTFIAQLTQGLNLLLRWTQNGSMRWYAAGIVFGAIILLAIAVRT